MGASYLQRRAGEGTIRNPADPTKPPGLTAGTGVGSSGGAPQSSSSSKSVDRPGTAGVAGGEERKGKNEKGAVAPGLVSCKRSHSVLSYSQGLVPAVRP